MLERLNRESASKGYEAQGGRWGSEEGYPMQMHIKRDCVIES